MTDSEIIEVTDKYRQLLIDRGAVRARGHEVPNKNHLLWMCGQLDDFIRDGRRDKAMRWLGFIQGALWALGIRSVDEMRKDNRSE